MAYYDTLKTYWATLSGTTLQKMNVVNAAVTTHVDVPVTSVIAYLAIQGKLAGLQSYAASPPAGAVPQAIVAAKELITLLSLQGITVFQMSDSNTYAAMQNFLNALASDTATGVVAADATALLNMANATMPWWKANGYPSPINETDLVAAGGLT